MGREARAVWRERVRRWKASGESGRAFAAREGVKEGTLRHWSWLLRHERKRGGTVSFVEVVNAGGALEVELRSGHRVRVPADFDEGTLQRLVAVLER